MEDTEKDEKNKITIKIKNFTNTINKELDFIKRNDGEELVFLNEDSEVVLNNGEDLKDFIKNYLNIPYIKLELIDSKYNNNIQEDDEISEIIPDNESHLSFIIFEKEEEEEKKDESITIFLKTSLSNQEIELTLEDEATLLDLKEKIKNLTHVEIDIQEIKFNGKEIKDNNKKLKDFGIISNCTIQMEIIKEDKDDNIIDKFLKDKDFFERKKILIENISRPSLGFVNKIFNIEEKLKDPKFKDLLFNPKYDSYFGSSRGYILSYNETQLKDVMKYKDYIDNNLLNK